MDGKEERIANLFSSLTLLDMMGRMEDGWNGGREGPPVWWKGEREEKWRMVGEKQGLREGKKK